MDAQLNELVTNANAASMAQVMVHVYELGNFLRETIVPLPWIVGILVALLAILGYQAIEDMGLRGLKEWWASLSRWPRFFGAKLIAWRGERLMRKKTLKEFEDRLLNINCLMIDRAVENDKITHTQANSLYKKLARGWEQYRHSIWKPEDTKAGIIERLKNEERDADGKIIPMKFPQEESKEVRKTRTLMPKRA